jgi:hypothetical protein
MSVVVNSDWNNAGLGVIAKMLGGITTQGTFTKYLYNSTNEYGSGDAASSRTGAVLTQTLELTNLGEATRDVSGSLIKLLDTTGITVAASDSILGDNWEVSEVFKICTEITFTR